MTDYNRMKIIFMGGFFMRKEMEAEFNLLKRTYLERGINGMTPRDSVELLLFFAGIEDPIMLMRTLFEKFSFKILRDFM